MNPVICSWNLDMPAGNDVVWPDGCRDVIAMFPQQQPAVLMCSGLDVTVRRIQCRSATRFLGIRLAPGVRLAWESASPAALQHDYAVPEECLPRQELSQSASPEAALRCLQQQVYNTLIAPPDWIADCLAEYCQPSRRSTPAGWARSERHLRRLLVAHTGMPPRYWRQLARMRAAARALVADDEPLASLAAAYQYADQAHLSRDIRRWLGCTPAMLRTAAASSEQQRAVYLARLSAPDAFSGV